MVKRLEIEDKVIVSSFNHKSIKYIKERYPEIECGIITVSNIHNVTEYILNIGVEYFHPLLETATEEVCQKVNKKGIKINAWADRKIESLDEVETLGLHGLISDYPEDVSRLLEKLPIKKQ